MIRIIIWTGWWVAYMLYLCKMVRSIASTSGILRSLVLFHNIGSSKWVNKFSWVNNKCKLTPFLIYPPLFSWQNWDIVWKCEEKNRKSKKFFFLYTYISKSEIPGLLKNTRKPMMSFSYKITANCFDNSLSCNSLWCKYFKFQWIWKSFIEH